MKLYNFGVNVKGRQPDTYKPIAWPIYVWTCYVPENVNPQINILEKLILSLVDKSIVRTEREIKDILINQIGIGSDLIDNVLDNCMDNYFDSRYKNKIVLNTYAENILAAIEDEISPEMQMSDLEKKVYLIQDAVTNTLVPCFSIDVLPEDDDYELIENQDCIVLQCTDVVQPKTAAIINALRQWGKIRKAIDNGEVSEENQIDIEKNPSDVKSDGSGMGEIPIKTLADATNKDKQVASITVYDDEPKTYFALAYCAFNSSNPTEIEIISPIGKVYDNWFMKLVNRIRINDNQFTEELQLFLMEKEELFKDRIAFDNDMDIQLFDEFPAICNNSVYADLKKAIRDLSKDVERIRKGEDESTNFAKNLRTAIEVVFRTAINAHPEIKAQKNEYCGDERNRNFNNDFGRYKLEISRLVANHHLDNAIRQNFSRKNIYKNMTHPHQSNPKDNAALILLYASKEPENFATRFVKDYGNIFIEMFDLYHLGTDAGHAGANFVNLYISVSDADRYYVQYECIVRAIFSYFIGGENNE